MRIKSGATEAFSRRRLWNERELFHGELIIFEFEDLKNKALQLTYEASFFII
jgi:hypothetical protein